MFQQPALTQKPPQPEPAAPDAVTTSEAAAIPSLLLIRDYITPAEEAALVAAIDAADGDWVALSRRRVQHYGYRCACGDHS